MTQGRRVPEGPRSWEHGWRRVSKVGAKPLGELMRMSFDQVGREEFAEAERLLGIRDEVVGLVAFLESRTTVGRPLLPEHSFLLHLARARLNLASGCVFRAGQASRVNAPAGAIA